jgi:hypothetical protein
MRIITEQERWEGFLDSYVAPDWFDHDERPKTMTAMREVFEKIPSEVWDEMPNLILVAPAPGIRGQVFPELDGGGPPIVFVYLSPELENKRVKQADVDFTVAHELAHVYLGHHQINNRDVRAIKTTDTYLNCQPEQKADALVKSWGFVIPEYRRA